MPRGGPRRPSNPAPVSGPGKFSRRTDGKQPALTPPLAGSPDMQYGDVQKLQSAQQIAPLPQGTPTPSARDLQPPSGPPRPSSRGQLPDWLINRPSSRPGEPGTTGLSTGPGDGPESLPMMPPDEREQVLTMIWQAFGNQDALKMLDQYRNERSAAGAQTVAPANPNAATLDNSAS